MAFLKHWVTGQDSWNPLPSSCVRKIVKIAAGPLTRVLLITLMPWHPGQCAASTATPPPPPLQFSTRSLCWKGREAPVGLEFPKLGPGNCPAIVSNPSLTLMGLKTKSTFLPNVEGKRNPAPPPPGDLPASRSGLCAHTQGPTHKHRHTCASFLSTVVNAIKQK